MTMQKQQQVLKWINTIMISLMTAGIMWSGNTLIYIRESIVKQQGTDVLHDSQIMQLKEDIGADRETNKNQDARISSIEAILPERTRVKKDISK